MIYNTADLLSEMGQASGRDVVQIKLLVHHHALAPLTDQEQLLGTFPEQIPLDAKTFSFRQVAQVENFRKFHVLNVE